MTRAKLKKGNKYNSTKVVLLGTNSYFMKSNRKIYQNQGNMTRDIVAPTYALSMANPISCTSIPHTGVLQWNGHMTSLAMRTPESGWTGYYSTNNKTKWNALQVVHSQPPCHQSTSSEINEPNPTDAAGTHIYATSHKVILSRKWLWMLVCYHWSFRGFLLLATQTVDSTRLRVIPKPVAPPPPPPLLVFS